MPTFCVDDLEIGVDEFLESCGDTEINEIISYLQENDFLTRGSNGHITSTEGGLNPLEHEWNKLISFLSDSRLSMSIEDEGIIRIIAKKYGYY